MHIKTDKPINKRVHERTANEEINTQTSTEKDTQKRREDPETDTPRLADEVDTVAAEALATSFSSFSCSLSSCFLASISSSSFFSSSLFFSLHVVFSPLSWRQKRTHWSHTFIQIKYQRADFSCTVMHERGKKYLLERTPAQSAHYEMCFFVFVQKKKKNGFVNRLNDGGRKKRKHVIFLIFSMFFFS